MDANVCGRGKRMYGVVGVGLMLLATAVGCGRARGDVSVAGAQPAGLVDTANSFAGGVVELQRGLPTGQPAVWYTERLAALDYRVTSMSYDRDGAAAYRVVKAAEVFDIRIAMDDDDAARSVEITPLVEQAGDSANTSAATPDTGALSPESSRAAPEEPEAESEPAIQEPRAPAAEIEPRIMEPRAPAADSAPRPPEPPVERSSPPPPPERYVVTVPAGSRIATRLDGRLSSADATVGEPFSMILREAVWADGVEVLPAGARMWGRVAEVEHARRPNKGGRIVLTVDAVQVGNDEFPLDGLVTAEDERLQGRDSTHEDIKEVAVGAGLGGLVGGLLGGKKGVLIGVLAGGGGTFVATKGEEVELNESTALVVELQRDLEVTFIGPA